MTWLIGLLPESQTTIVIALHFSAVLQCSCCFLKLRWIFLLLNTV